MEVITYSDEEWLLEPLWLTEPRGFHSITDDYLDMIETWINAFPLSVIETWSRDPSQSTIELTDLSLSFLGDARTGELRIVASSSTVPRRYLDPLRQDLRHVMATFDPLSARTLDFGVLQLQLIETSVAHLQLWKSKTSSAPPAPGPDPWSASTGPSWSALLDDRAALDLSSLPDVATHLLPVPIASICASLPPWLRLLHAEPVFRSDLASRFLARQEAIATQLASLPHSLLLRAAQARGTHSLTTALSQAARRDHASLAEHLAAPAVTFHGAPRSVVPSIVRHGLLVPGSSGATLDDGTPLRMRCGQAFGAGIYTSPDALYASTYSSYMGRSYDESAQPDVPALNPASVPGLRLLVCATLLGATLAVGNEAYGARGPLAASAHSHAARAGLETVVFDSAQVLPCYVLHLDYGAAGARDEFARLLVDPREFARARMKREQKAKKAAAAAGDEDADEEQREAWMPWVKRARKERLKAAAAKWFPFGYGPATGTRFVVEEVGEVSEDEEIYGEYQGERVEDEGEVRARREMVEKGGSWFDEYQMVRKAKVKKRDASADRDDE